MRPPRCRIMGRITACAHVEPQPRCALTQFTSECLGALGTSPGHDDATRPQPPECSGDDSAHLTVSSNNQDPAGVSAVSMVIIFGSIVIATAAAVFQRLLQNAVDIKSENELTV